VRSIHNGQVPDFEHGYLTMCASPGERCGPSLDVPGSERRFPWYDSEWLTEYVRAKSIIQTERPAAVEDFVNAFRVLHTPPSFQVKVFESVFNGEVFERIRRVAASQRPIDLKLHEAQTFRRFVVHNNPIFAELQQQIIPLVSDAVGEAVEASYNFLSFYRTMGICPIHIDAPTAKWTLDLCVNQSAPWPIYFSQVRPWPESVPESWCQEGWETRIKQSPVLQFTPYTLQPQQAVLFSGSSQWHYRDAITRVNGRQFCDLLFFHFRPVGTAELVRPQNWARLFGMRELTRNA
jgi:hypothetical protein